MEKLDDLINRLIPPATKESREGFSNKGIINDLSSEKKLEVEMKLIEKLQHQYDSLVLNTLVYLGSKKAIPAMKGWLKKEVKDYDPHLIKIMIATAVFELDGSESEMRQIAKAECRLLTDSNDLMGSFYMLAKFKDNELNAFIEGFVDHEDLWLSSNAKSALGLSGPEAINMSKGNFWKFW